MCDHSEGGDTMEEKRRNVRRTSDMNVCGAHAAVRHDVNSFKTESSSLRSKLEDLEKTIEELVDKYISPLLTFMNRTKGGIIVLAALAVSFLIFVLTVALVINGSTKDAISAQKELTDNRIQAQDERQKRHEEAVTEQQKQQSEQQKRLNESIAKLAQSVESFNAAVNRLEQKVDMTTSKMEQQITIFASTANRNQADIENIMRRLLNESSTIQREVKNVQELKSAVPPVPPPPINGMRGEEYRNNN